MAQTKLKGKQVETFNGTTEGVVPASGGGTTNFLRADGTWTTPPVDTSTTSNVSEGSNLYFTTARVLGTVLSGLSLATGGAIVSTDSILVAFGKIQKQIDDLTTSIGNKLNKDTTSGVERAYIINADGSQGTKATSEIGTTQNYFPFSTNTTLTNSHHNAVIWVTATINITIPSGLRSDFNCTFRTLTGAIATFLTSGTTINAESDGDVQAAKTMSFLAQYTTNNYIISGGGLS